MLHWEQVGTAPAKNAAPAKFGTPAKRIACIGASRVLISGVNHTIRKRIEEKCAQCRENIATVLGFYGAAEGSWGLFRPGKEWEDRLFIQTFSRKDARPAERFDFWLSEKVLREQFRFFEDFKNHSLEPYFPGEFDEVSATPIWSVREYVPFNSMQMVGYRGGIVEIDFDIGNPDYGPLSAAVHMVEFLHPGKTDPFRILKGLRRRGIEVRDVREPREAERIGSREADGSGPVSEELKG